MVVLCYHLLRCVLIQLRSLAPYHLRNDTDLVLVIFIDSRRVSKHHRRDDHQPIRQSSPIRWVGNYLAGILCGHGYSDNSIFGMEFGKLIKPYPEAKID